MPEQVKVFVITIKYNNADNRVRSSTHTVQAFNEDQAISILKRWFETSNHNSSIESVKAIGRYERDFIGIIY